MPPTQTKPSSASVGARKLVDPKDIKALTEKAEIYSVHPEVIAALHHTDGVMEHVKRARQEGQNEFLLVRFKSGDNRVSIAETANIVHIIRQKPIPVSEEKLDGLVHRRFMLIHEPHAIHAIRTFAPKGAIITPGSGGVKIS